MLTIVRSVAVLDRTGALQWALRGNELDILDLRPAEFDVELPDVDVLLIGPEDLTAAGLRRVNRWSRRQPAGVAVAHLDGIDVDRERLRAAGVRHLVRGRATPAKLRNVLRHADVTLAELVAAAGRHVPTALEAVDEAPDEVGTFDELADPYPAEAELDPAMKTARLLTVASATGGCGKTFFATNAAS